MPYRDPVTPDVSGVESSFDAADSAHAAHFAHVADERRSALGARRSAKRFVPKPSWSVAVIQVWQA